MSGGHGITPGTPTTPPTPSPAKIALGVVSMVGGMVGLAGIVDALAPASINNGKGVWFGINREEETQILGYVGFGVVTGCLIANAFI